MDVVEAGTAVGGALPKDLVFVDLETTGGNAACHRITEVGIVQMENGAVVDEWSSLVNPDSRIAPYIESFTGITNEMVAGAPRFAEIAALVRDKLRASVFVAHNARFDYAFLRAEFKRLECQFSAKVMCTVKLSRRLYPEFPRHNLDAVMERHGLRCSARHRALGDARVLGDLWSKLLVEIPPERLAAATQAVMGAKRLPAHLPVELADELPEGPGVYRLYGEDDVLLYVGKSHSLRSRILGHFVGENSSAPQQKKILQTRRIDWLETAGELGAQLKEVQWIKAQRPLYNGRLHRAEESYTLRPSEGGDGIEFKAVVDLDVTSLAGCFGVFHSRKDAQKALVDIAGAHSLCLKVILAEAGAGSCFAYQIGKCRGACIGKEPIAWHNARLMMALAALKLETWPFPGRVALREGHGEYHVLDRWAYCGTAHSEEELAELRCNGAAAAFDVDVYRLLVRYFKRNPRLAWHNLQVDGSQAFAHDR